MEGDKSFQEDGPPAGNDDSNVPEENPTMLSPGGENKEPTSEENPIMSSPITGGENKKPTSEEKPIISSPITGGETREPTSEESPITSDENKRPTESHNHRKATSLGGAEFDNTPDVSVDQKNRKEEEEAPASYHRRAVSVDQLVSKANARPKLLAKSSLGRSQVDTATPIESVKAAVSKFGGIVDWKAHRVQTTERRKFIETELEKAQDEIPTYQQQCEAAEERKTQVLKELDGTKRLIEELKLNLERAQKEEQQAKQDTELAKLRLEEMEQGIADEVSRSVKAQLEVARERHLAAVSELKSVNEELEQLKKDYDLLVVEKELAKKKEEEAVSSSKEAEKSVQDLSIELIALKQSLESAHSEHLEVEEHRVGAIMAKEEYNVNWEEDLRQAEEEIEKLNQQMMVTNELKMKLNEATALLQDLKDELAVYLETKVDGMEVEGNFLLTDKKTRGDIKGAINALGKELLEVKIKIMKANEEGNETKMEEQALKSDLEKEKMELVEIQERESKSSMETKSVEVELNAVNSEIEVIRMKEKEESEKMAELPSKLEEAEKEAEHAKVVKEKAHEELMKAKQESEEAKSGKTNKETELKAAEKEIEASKAVEKLALEAITVLEKSESFDESSPTTGVTLSLEEYFELSKQALDAEEHANTRVASAMSEIEVAKESEERTLKKLEEVSSIVSKRKEELEMVRKKAEEAEERKVAVELELRKRKGEDQSEIEVALDLKVTKKKKKSFFPRFFMFMGKKKTQTSRKD